MIRITVEGPNKSGKGHVIALLAHMFKDHGIDCVVQGEYGCNANKMVKVDEELFTRLKEAKVAIMGQQTAL
jgi:thymidylate kinase